MVPARRRVERELDRREGGAEQVPARHHCREGFYGRRTQRAHRAAWHLAERMAAVTDHPSAVSRNPAVRSIDHAKRTALIAALVAFAPALAGGQARPPANPPAPKSTPPSEHHDHDAMSMPIPMPKGMPMMPGLKGLRPPVTPFLPNAGVDPATLPAAKPVATVKLKDGDTLDLSAGFVRRTIRGNQFVMYAFNGMVPGPLIRVAQKATITVRFHNRIDLPSAIHWHGLRHDNRNDGVPGLTQEEVAPGKSFTYKVR